METVAVSGKHRIRRSALAVIAGLATLASWGCGTRVHQSETSLSAKQSQSPLAAGAPVGGESPVDSSGLTGAAPTVAGTGTAPSPSASGAVTAPVGATNSAGVKAPGATSSGKETPGASPGTPQSGTPAAAGATGGGSGTTAVTTPAPTGKRSVLRIGHVGTLSGPAGANFKPVAVGGQIWSKWINERGGLNGHPVEFIVVDDGGDPARHRAQVQELVETKRVIAFLANTEALTGQGTVDYLEAKRIPVVGTTGAENWASTSPMYFPQAPTGQQNTDSMFGSMAQQMKARGKSKLGVIACTELQFCRNFYDQAEAQAKRWGLQLVYKGSMSLAQPDFTAECLSAQRAGAETLFLGMDSNSIRRFAASCARQGYKPMLSTALAATTDDFKSEPNFDGNLTAQSPVFPYFQDTTPATQEFQQVIRQYAPGMGLTGGLALGWSAAKLLERIGPSIGEPPTSDQILTALWSLRGEDLGGLTLPLTYTRDKPTVHKVCWYNTAVEKGKWVSPDGYKRSCEGE